VILKAHELLKNQVWKDTLSGNVTIQQMQQHSIKHAMIMEDKKYQISVLLNIAR